jgi:hypothetical protein
VRRADLPTSKDRCDSDCTQQLEEKLRTQGMSFLNRLRLQEKRFLDRPKSFVSRRAIRRNSSFVILASSLVGSCFVASKQEHEQEAGLQRIYAS